MNPSEGDAAGRQGQPPRLILASGSLRRRDLLSRLGIAFEVRAPDINEAAPPGEAAEVTVLRLASEKARLIAGTAPDAIVLAADTLVELDGVTLGKPASTEIAKRYLLALRARPHVVASGVCLVTGGREVARLVTTRVQMRAYSGAEIARTIAAGTPFDKAGAYAIQDEDFCPVESIDGCYCNVMGLPLWTVFELLQSTDLANCAPPPRDARPSCGACPLHS